MLETYSAGLLYSVSDQIQNLQNCWPPQHKNLGGEWGGPQTNKLSPQSHFAGYIFKTKRFCIALYVSYPSIRQDGSFHQICPSSRFSKECYIGKKRKAGLARKSPNLAFSVPPHVSADDR